MKFIDRNNQKRKKGFLFSEGSNTILDDSFFDGELTPETLRVKNWNPENRVHESDVVSETAKITRNFLGQNENAIRDDLRKKTIIAFIHGNGELKLIESFHNSQVNETVILKESVLRSDLALDKYTGKIYISAIIQQGKKQDIYFNGNILKTKSKTPDFPFFAISQVPIGHIPDVPFEYGLLTYKCRDTGILFLRRFENGKLGKEVVLPFSNLVGGAGIAISNDQVIIRIDAYVNGKLTVLLSKSKDKGMTFSEFTPVELPYDKSFKLLPASSPPIQDFSSSFHIPIGVANTNETVALDLIVDHALVESIRVSEPFDFYTSVGTAAFPKTSPCNTRDPILLRFGDGITDGIGIIATLNANGNLYSSNSQAGGIHYPEFTHLNHEMPDIRSLNVTECYTEGTNPNKVSMDYLYIESTKKGGPIGSDIHFETWEMPLPKPLGKAKFNGKQVNVKILKDANFFQGKTTVQINDPIIEIESLKIQEVRKASVTLSSTDVIGKTLIFEVKSQFHHHRIEMVIE